MYKELQKIGCRVHLQTAKWTRASS